MRQRSSFHAGKKFPLKQVGQRIQDIGDDQSVDDRLDETEKLPDSPENDVDMGQHQIEENRNAESDCVISPFFFFPVVVKFHLSCLPVPIFCNNPVPEQKILAACGAYILIVYCRCAGKQQRDEKYLTKRETSCTVHRQISTAAFIL